MEYKGYNIANDGTYGMKHIKSIGRGSVSASLKGAFSDDKQAKIAIDAVIEEKGEKDGTTKGSNRG